MSTVPGDHETRIDNVPHGAILDHWSESAWEDGFRLDQLRDLQSLQVRTANSLYELTIISGSEGEVLVRGGRYLPEWTPAVFSGSTFGGSFIKIGSIHVGMRMEFRLGDLNIFTTSPVQWIGPVEDPAALTPPGSEQRAP